MTAALSIFRFDGADVRTVVIDGEPWFVAADVARVLGYRMASDFTRRLDADEKGTHSVRTPGGTQDVSVISESGLYVAVIGSQAPSAREFKRWITREVIPAIRKTGTYIQAPALPQNYSAALRELAAEVEQREALQAKVAQDAPKVLFADAVATADTDILVGDLAKILRGNNVEVGANRLFDMLRADGYLIRRRGSDWNMPTQRSMELGLFRVKETAVTHSDGHVTISKTPKVTGKGQAYFVNRYASRVLEVAS